SRSGFREQGVEIERTRNHGELSLGRPRPLLPGAIAVELDAVAVGVAQVDRLADSVIGCAFERDSGVENTPQRGRQRSTARVPEGDVVEARCAGWRRRPALALQGVQADVVVVAPCA